MTQSDACGDLREKLTVLTLSHTTGAWSWIPLRQTWANIAPAKGQTIFSRVGTGAPGVSLVCRKQSIRPGQLLRWKDQYIYPVAVRSRGLTHLEVDGAIVQLSACCASPDAQPPGARFPAILTEKYLKHEQEDPYSVNDLTYVLVTPPEIMLRPGTLVQVDTLNYEVLVVHALDPSKLEYEINRRGDL